MDNLLSAIESLPSWVVTSLSLMALVVIALLADTLTKRQLVQMVHRLSSRTNQIWDDALADQGVFARVAQVVPALIFYFGLPLIQGLPEKLVTLGQNVASAYAILLISLALAWKSIGIPVRRIGDGICLHRISITQQDFQTCRIKMHVAPFFKNRFSKIRILHEAENTYCSFPAR